MNVVKTFAPVAPGGLWLDIVRDGPGQYSVHAINNLCGNPVAYGFYLEEHAEEWVVETQARQLGWVRAQ